MAKKKRSKAQVAKSSAKKAGAVAAAGYAWRLNISGEAAKRKAQKSAVRSDLKRVGRVADRVGNTKAGRKVGNSPKVIGTALKAERAGQKAKKFAGKGPVDLARNTKNSFKAGKAVSAASRHVGANKGKYAAGAAVGVAGVGAAYAYKKRKAAASGSVTYKRRTKSGKVITVTRRKGKR